MLTVWVAVRQGSLTRFSHEQMVSGPEHNYKSFVNGKLAARSPDRCVWLKHNFKPCVHLYTITFLLCVGILGNRFLSWSPSVFSILCPTIKMCFYLFLSENLGCQIKPRFWPVGCQLGNPGVQHGGCGVCRCSVGPESVAMVYETIVAVGPGEFGKPLCRKRDWSGQGPRSAGQVG